MEENSALPLFTIGVQMKEYLTRKPNHILLRVMGQPKGRTGPFVK